MSRKKRSKRLIKEAALFISDLAIAASGLNETIDIRRMVGDFFMYSHLLLQHLRNRLLQAFFSIGSQLVKYKSLLVYALLIPAVTALLLHFTMAAVLVLFLMMGTERVLRKEKIQEDRVTNLSSL